MGYYIRVLGLSNNHVPVAELRARLKAEGLTSSLTIEAGDETDWTEILLRDDETDIALIEKNVVAPESLGEEEIAEFIEELEEARPASAANWLKGILAKVQVIYAFQLLDLDSTSEDGGNAVQEMLACLKEKSEGFVQADGEGFSNVEGAHILWQFSDSVSGPWTMAVLDGEGDWQTFVMELGNKKHRKAFLEGRVPDGVEIL